MATTLKRKLKNSLTVIHEFMFFEAPIQMVSSEVIAWGESSWWPSPCLWKYIRLTEGPIRVGTQYTIKINKPSAQDWSAEVSQLLPNRMVERVFTKGLFKGFERIMLEERANGTRMDYELHFQIRGILNLLLWPLVLRRQYLNTIKKITGALKSYITTQAEKSRDEWSDKG